MAENETTGGPHFAAFITMIVGLLLFFGMVSRVGKLAEPGGVLTFNNRLDVETARQKLEEERQKALALIGSGQSAAELNDALPRTTVPASGRTPPTAIKSAPAQTKPPAVTPVVPARPALPPQPEANTSRPRPAGSLTYRNYTVTAGDTLYRIAQNQMGDGNKWRDLLKANPSLKPQQLRVGQRLLVPVPSVPTAQADAPRESRL